MYPVSSSTLFSPTPVPTPPPHSTPTAPLFRLELEEQLGVHSRVQRAFWGGVLQEVGRGGAGVSTDVLLGPAAEAARAPGECAARPAVPATALCALRLGFFGTVCS